MRGSSLYPLYHSNKTIVPALNHPFPPQGRFASGRAAAGARAEAAYPAPAPPHPAPAAYSAMDVDGETDSNHDTALTLACAGGHEELVELLLSRGADIEHRDKKVTGVISNSKSRNAIYGRMPKWRIRSYQQS